MFSMGKLHEAILHLQLGTKREGKEIIKDVLYRKINAKLDNFCFCFELTTYYFWVLTFTHKCVPAELNLQR